FDRALELEPQQAEVFVHRGLTYICIQEYDRAVEDFDRALTLEPSNALAYAGKGLAFLWLEDVEEAITSYTCSWELSRLNVNAGLMVEWCRMCQQRAIPQTIERLETIAAIDSERYVGFV